MVGFTLERNEEQDDRHSVHSIASTVATTTSLASRIRDLNLDFGDKLQEQAEEEEEEEEQKEADRATAAQSADQRDAARSDASETVSGAAPGAHAVDDEGGVHHSLHLLHRDVPLQPLQVCCRLFERRSHPVLPLKRMSMMQVEDFRQHGYVVLDGLITKDAALRIKAEAARLASKGLLQPVSPACMATCTTAACYSNGNGSSSNGVANGVHHGIGNGISSIHSVSSSASSSSQSLVLNGSPCHSSSNCAAHTGCANGSASASTGRLTNGTPSRLSVMQLQQQLQQQQQRCGELRMPLQLGAPPADTTVFAPLMAALQELQEDLSEFVRLRSKGHAEYCLCQLPSGSCPVARHRDALPDDGRQEGGSSTPSASAAPPPLQQQAQQLEQQQQQQQQQQQSSMQPGQASSHQAAAPGSSGGPHVLGPAARRVSLLAFLNADWDKEGGGVVRLWPPSRTAGPPSTAAASAARRSPTSSDAGTTFSEISDCGSLRVAFMGSTTSSVIAEASAPDHDTYSLDGISVAESEAERQGFEWVECDGEMALDIAPLAGRVLLVLSGAVDHALLPGAGPGPGSDLTFVRAWCC